MEKLKMPSNCSSVDFEQRDKINEIINELENIALDLKALFQFKENVEDAKKVDDLIKINTFVDKKINEKDCYMCNDFNKNDDYCTVCKSFNYNYFQPIQKPKEQITNVNLDDIAIAEVKHEKQSKLDEARNYKYASGEGWCSYQTMEYDIENIKQLYEQAIQELQCQIVDDPNEVGKLKQYNENLLNDKLYYKKKYDKLKVVKNQKIKVDEEYINLLKYLTDNENYDSVIHMYEKGILKKLLFILDKKEE